MPQRLSHLNDARGGRSCAGCGNPLTGKRGDATTCSVACRMRIHRGSATPTTRTVKGEPPVMDMIEVVDPELAFSLRNDLTSQALLIRGADAVRMWRELHTVVVDEADDGPPSLAGFIARNT